MGAGPRRGSAAAQLLRRPGSLRCPLLITFPRASGNIPPTPRESLILWDPNEGGTAEPPPTQVPTANIHRSSH